MPQGPPYSLPTGLPALVVGRARNVTLQVRKSDGSAASDIYTTGTTLAATLWSGDKTVALATPTVSWLGGSTGATAGQVQVQFAASDTASLSAGEFLLEVTGTTSGTTESLVLVALPLVDAAGSSTGNALDLVTLATVQGALAAVLPADQAFIAKAITAASRMVQRYCRRWFVVQQYLEIVQPKLGLWGRGKPDVVYLKQCPIVGAPILRTSWTDALAIQNSSAAVQDAYVGFTTSGDPDISLTNTGLTLTAIAGGAATVQTVNWTTAAPYTTIQNVVDAINALGNGWVATLQQPTFSGLGAYQLFGGGAMANALTPEQAIFGVFQQPISFSGLEPHTGLVSIAPGMWSGGYGGGYGVTTGGNWLLGGSSGATGSYRPPVLAIYTAGFATIPEDVQFATIAIIKAMLGELKTSTVYKSETVGDWSGTLADAADRVFPASVKAMLDRWVLYRVVA